VFPARSKFPSVFIIPLSWEAGGERQKGLLGNSQQGKNRKRFKISFTKNASKSHRIF
jgi:hypothetical protein